MSEDSKQKYPASNNLKQALSGICSENPDYCDAIAQHFGSNDVSCSNRVPQSVCFTLGQKYGVSNEDCAKVASHMCQFTCKIDK